MSIKLFDVTVKVDSRISSLIDNKEDNISDRDDAYESEQTKKFNKQISQSSSSIDRKSDINKLIKALPKELNFVKNVKDLKFTRGKSSNTKNKGE